MRRNQLGPRPIFKPRDLAFLKLYALGCTTKEIAKNFDYSYATVKNALLYNYKKFDLTGGGNRINLFLLLLKHGFFASDELFMTKKQALQAIRIEGENEGINGD